jgi:hypothetical protein
MAEKHLRRYVTLTAIKYAEELEKKKEIIRKKDEVIESLLRRLNKGEKDARDQLEVIYCSYCPEWEILFKEDHPAETLNFCSRCWKPSCIHCAEAHEWKWWEEIQKIEDPPYFTDYYCDECAQKL